MYVRGELTPMLWCVSNPSVLIRTVPTSLSASCLPYVWIESNLYSGRKSFSIFIEADFLLLLFCHWYDSERCKHSSEGRVGASRKFSFARLDRTDVQSTIKWEHTQFLMSILNKYYDTEKDWKGEVCCGITLTFNILEGCVNISMPK